MGTDTPNAEALMQGLFDAFNDQDWEWYADHLAEDVVMYEDGGHCQGVDAVIEHDTSFYETYPDASITVDQLFGAGNTAAARTSITGTPTETAQASEPVDTWGLVFGTIEDGRLPEIWVLTE
jgi:predicted ester cyclase